MKRIFLLSSGILSSALSLFSFFVMYNLYYSDPDISSPAELWRWVDILSLGLISWKSALVISILLLMLAVFLFRRFARTPIKLS